MVIVGVCIGGTFMVQIDWNKWIAYNNDELLIIVEAYDKEPVDVENPDLIKSDIYCRIYSNKSNVSTKDIKINLKKTVSMKDRINFRVKKDLLYGPFIKMVVFDKQKALMPVHLTHDVSKSKMGEIIKMIETFLKDGKIEFNIYVENGFKIENCNLEELTKILNGFEILEYKHKKLSSNTNR